MIQPQISLSIIVEEQETKRRQFKRAKRLDIDLMCEDETPKLTVQTPKYYNSPKINQRRFSTRNDHKKKFDFSPRVQFDLSQQKLKLLEHQKTILMLELQNLKEGAVSAIIEKEEEIQLLKEKIYTETINHQLAAVHQKNSKKQILQKTVNEKNMLEKELYKIKHTYETTIIEKDRHVIELAEELQLYKAKIAELNKNRQKLEQSLNQLESENSSLNNQLMNSTINAIEMKNILNTSNILGSIVSDRQSANSSSFEFKNIKTQQSLNGRKLELLQMNQKQKLDQLKLLHQRLRHNNQQELEQIRFQYQQRLENLRSIYQKQIENARSSIPEHQQYMYDFNEDYCIEKLDLRNDIKIAEENFKADEDKSEVTVKSNNMARNCDSQSQFSYKHFQYYPKLFSIKDQQQASSKDISIVKQATVKKDLQELNNSQRVENTKDFQKFVKPQKSCFFSNQAILLLGGVAVGILVYLFIKERK